MTEQFAHRREGAVYRVGLVDPKQGNRFVEIATVEQQHWANRITLALNAISEPIGSRSYIQTNNPDDPCSLCVQWMTPEGGNVESMEDAERALPFIGPGKVAPRIFAYVHDECEAAAIQYTTEASA